MENNHRRKILFIDPISYGLPSTYEWIKLLYNLNYDIKYIGSNTKYNSEYFKEIKLICSNYFSSNISHSLGIKKINQLYNILILYKNIIYSCIKAEFIIYRWLPLPFIDLIIILIFKNKVAYICDNHIPHRVSNDFIFKNNKFRICINFIIHYLISKFIDQIWFPSNFTLNKFKNFYKTDKQKLFLCQHGTFGIKINAKSKSYLPIGNFKKMVFWGNIKKYKGIENLIDLSVSLKNSPNLELEIHGKWHECKEMKDYFKNNNVLINDKFLNSNEVEKLLVPKNLFLLPYLASTQSGIVYNLLFYGCYFLISGEGETKEFLYENNLSCMHLNEFSLANINMRINYILKNSNDIAIKLNKIKNKTKWGVPSI